MGLDGSLLWWPLASSFVIWFLLLVVTSFAALWLTRGRMAKSGDMASAPLRCRASSRSAILPAGREVELYNDHIFGKLREFYGIQDDFLNEGWSFKDLRPGGGKGGALMAFVRHDYIVKEMGDGDHLVLSDIATRYYRHILKGDSLLSIILLHYRDVSLNKRFFVMRNAMGPGPFESMYDLKGCADDRTLVSKGKTVVTVNKRIWNLHMWCGQCLWTPDRVLYYEGKLRARSLKMLVAAGCRTRILEALRRDVAWLEAEQLMDYSLLLGSKANDDLNASSVCFPDLDAAGRHIMRRRLPNGRETELYVSIIDFLGRWTKEKVVANCIKVAERNKATIHPTPYAQRFAAHFERMFVVENNY